MTKIKLLTIASSLTVCLVMLFALPVQAQWLVNNKMENPYDNLSITIPGMKRFSEIYKDPVNNHIEINWIGEYIVGIYNYMMGIIALVAMVTMAMGGALWIVSAGDSGKISQAKSWITGSLTGLTLALCAYLMLGLINPDLVIMRPISLDMTGVQVGTAMTEEPEGDDATKGTGGGRSPFNASDAVNKDTVALLAKANINCDRDVNWNLGKTGGIQANINIVNGEMKKFRSNMVYRFGSKNGKGTDAKRGAVTAPQVSFDCSGFVNQVLWCAGFPIGPGEGTSKIFASNATVITSCANGLVNGTKVEAGDLIGWPPGSGEGHVLISAGGDWLVDSHGTGTNGTKSSYGTYKLCDYIEKYKAKKPRIKRIRDYQKF